MAHRLAVLTDSSCDLTPAVCERYGIFVLPLPVIYPDRTYHAGVDITADDIYARMPDEIPKTSLPDGDTVLRFLDTIRSQGYTQVAAILLSSGLSGTYNLVRLLAEQYEGLDIDVYDSKSASVGIGMLALQTAAYAAQGRDLAALREVVPALIENTAVFFTPETLLYLQKGGRIGRITCAAGTVLQLKPLIGFGGDGQLESVGKSRGMDRALDELARRIGGLVPAEGAYNLLIVHGGAPDYARQLLDRLDDVRAGCQCLCTGMIGCTLACHVGPHLIGGGVQCLPAGAPQVTL